MLGIITQPDLSNFWSILDGYVKHLIQENAMDESKLPMYNPANPQFSIDFILSKARGSLLASGLNNHAFNTAMTGTVLNFHHFIDRVTELKKAQRKSVLKWKL